MSQNTHQYRIKEFELTIYSRHPTTTRIISSILKIDTSFSSIIKIIKNLWGMHCHVWFVSNIYVKVFFGSPWPIKVERKTISNILQIKRTKHTKIWSYIMVMKPHACLLTICLLGYSHNKKNNTSISFPTNQIES